MAQFSHPNIIELKGVVTKSKFDQFVYQVAFAWRRRNWLFDLRDKLQRVYRTRQRLNSLFRY